MTIMTKTDSNDENKAEDDGIVMVTNLGLIFFRRNKDNQTIDSDGLVKQSAKQLLLNEVFPLEYEVCLSLYNALIM